MKKKIAFLVLLLGFTVYILGVFHPKETLVDNLVISAPENTIFTSIKDDDKIIDYFTLPFIQKNEYTTKDNKEVKMTISSDFFHKQEGKIIFVKIRKEDLDYFRGYVKHLTKKREMKKLKGLTGGLCESYYFLENSNSNYLIFEKEKDIFIDIISSVNVDGMIKNICK